MGNTVEIVIADSSPIIRSGLAAIIAKIDSFHLNVVEVREVVTVSTFNYRHRPDVVLINPTFMGLFSPNSLRNEMGNPNLKIVAIQSALLDGVLLESYDEVVSIYDSEENIKDKIKKMVELEELEQGKKPLSQREKEIIVCVVKGKTNKQIADELFLSTHTVIAHRRNIATKLQIHSPSGLTIYAIVNKLVDLSEIKNGFN